jgi:pilus assembly protein CpaE
MNARTYPTAERVVIDHFVFASLIEEHATWLAATLVESGASSTTTFDAGMVLQRIAALNPSIVFVDFAGGHAAPASAATAAIRTAHPTLPIIAVGSMKEPESAVAALRSGVRDFIDLSAASADAVRITRQVLDHLVEPVSRHGRVTVLLGARIGVGVSTLAANLAVLLQQRGQAQQRQTALLDLGLPAGDGMLYLNAQSELHFVDAVRNLRRFDQTFVQTALSRHTSGVALTTLPADLAEMREISFAGSIGLVNRLRAFFDQQVIDLGGFSNQDFIAQMVRAADETWLVCEQGVAPILSATALIEMLKEREVDTATLRLIVNKHDAGLGLAPEQIAEQLALPLGAVLPARAVPLGRAVNQGKLLAEFAERDPYIQALHPLIERLTAGSSEPRTTGFASRWRGTVSSLKRVIPTSNKRSDH